MLRFGWVNFGGSVLELSCIRSVLLTLTLLAVLCSGCVCRAASQEEHRYRISLDDQIDGQLNTEVSSLTESTEINNVNRVQTSTLYIQTKPATSPQNITMERMCIDLRENESTSDGDLAREEFGWIPYFYIYDHLLKSYQWLAIILFVLWMAMLFSLLMVSTDNFFLPNLIFISDKLRLHPEVAGLTVLALGNGASDFITNVACFVNGSPSIAFGSIIGTGLFITTFVAGCVVLAAKKLQVNPVSFFRDIIFYLASLGVLFVSILIGKIWIYQPIILLILYAAYIICAISNNFKLTKYFPGTKQSEEAQDVFDVERAQDIYDMQQYDEQNKIQRIVNSPLSVGDDASSKGKVQQCLSSPMTNEGKRASPFWENSFFCPYDVKNLPETFPKKYDPSEDVDFSLIYDRCESTSHKIHHTNKLFRVVRSSNDNLSRSENAALIKYNEKKYLSISLDERCICNSPNSSSKQQDTDSMRQNNAYPPIEPGAAFEREIISLSPLNHPQLDLYSISARIEKKKIYQYVSNSLKLCRIFKIFNFVYWIFKFPLYLIITTPEWNQLTAITSIIFFWPIFFLAIDKLNINYWHVPLFVFPMLISCVTAFLVYSTSSRHTTPSYQPIFNLLSFVTCLVVMYIIGEELVALVKTLGILFSIPGFILGATFVTFGNSLVEIFVNTSLAKEGKAEVAFAAVYGGPMLSLALGFGLILLVVAIQSFPIPYQAGFKSPIFLENILFLLGNVIITAIFCSTLFRFQVTKKMCLFWWFYYFVYLIFTILHKN